MAYRDEIREVEGTPPFQFQNPEIGAGGIWIIDLENDSELTPKYLPMDTLTITNDSNYNINVYINQTSNHVVYAASGTIKTISDVKFNSLKVENLSGINAIPAKSIMIAVMRQGYNADKAAYAQAKRRFRGLFPVLVAIPFVPP